MATGRLSGGDACVAIDPLFDVGMAMGMTRTVLLRDLLRAIGAREPEELALRSKAKRINASYYAQFALLLGSEIFGLRY